MKERFIFGFDFFVLPFTVGMVFALLYLSVGAVKIIISLTPKERKKFFISLLPPKIFGTIWEIIRDVLLHLKIFKKNLLLGYMHASIAFGWFLLIVIGHIEVFLYTPHRGGVLYYPIFFRYFVAEVNHTLKGAFLFFLMDFFLLIVLSGVALAIFKRFKSKRLGMVRTTRHPLGDRVALYSLWAIFPLRLLAESFTAEISGGSFLTKSLNSMLAGIPFYNNMMELSWWLYSIALALFFFTLPLSRYMHIPTEILLILLRRAGITSQTSRGGFAEAQIYSCSSCGLCIDGCPLCSAEGKEPFTAVYFIRKLRRGSPDTPLFAQECLLCGKCTQLCPVEIDSSRLRLLKKREESPLPTGRYSYLREAPNNNMREGGSDKVLYYSGCMGHLTPSIYKSLLNILDRASIDYTFFDREGSICCGRPLQLLGDREGFREMIEVNKSQIEKSGAKRVLLSCPICYKIFKEEYNFTKIEVIHHTQYLKNLLNEGKISLKKSATLFSYHDPCDLGRGSNIYNPPREILSAIGQVVESECERELSHCCGGSLANLNFTSIEREKITREALRALNPKGSAQAIVTACPLCLKTFTTYSSCRVADIAQIVNEQMI